MAINRLSQMKIGRDGVNDTGWQRKNGHSYKMAEGARDPGWLVAKMLRGND
jgi:hypothetical protein